MKTYYGIVEDRQDPLKIGRVRVRVHTVHSDNKKLDLSTPDLPWAQVMLPTTSAGLSGFGTQHGLVEGSTVMLYFLDGDMCQQPVIIGSVAGIPQAGYRENTKQTHLLGMRVGVCQPGDLTVNGLFFVIDEESTFIDITKKNERISVPNFSIDSFKQCVAKLQREMVMG